MSDFAKNIAQYVQLYAPAFGVKVVSPSVAQAILETGDGVDASAQVKVANHNVLGLKYSHNDPERISSFSHFFTDGGWEVVNGMREELDPNTSYWYGFTDVEQCVIGYFEFLQKSWYAPLKECTTAEEYCHTIKECGYATDPDYPTKLLSIIERYELSQYDVKTESEEQEMSNSSLVSYTKISPNKTSPRNAEIDTITIHCVVGQWTAQKIADYFASSTLGASCNYGVGTDGSVSLVVDEGDRSWCSSKPSNDHRAVTIEVASDITDPYTVNDVAYEKLIELVADICKRNNIKELKWQGDSSLVGQVDKQNMTVHRWFAAKACPGEFLYNKHGAIASRVNALLNGHQVEEVMEEVNSDSTYTVVAGDTLSKIASTHGLTIDLLVEINAIEDVNKITIGQVLNLQQSAESYLVRVTDNSLNIRAGAGTSYNIVGTITDKGVYTIVETVGTWGRLKSGLGWISLNYTEKV